MLGHVDTVQDSFEGQCHRSKFKVTGGKQELSNCGHGRSRLKSRPELETAYTQQPNEIIKLVMWANAQRDGRPAEYRWRPLFNAAKFG